MKLKTFAKKVLRKLRGGMVTLYPEGESCGRVLLSYKTESFVEFEEKVSTHSNVWECREIARIFLKRGFTVDVIDWFNHQYLPKKEYKYFLDIHFNLERLNSILGKDCIKIFHATTSHWLFNNNAEMERLINLEKRRGVMLKARRKLEPAQDIENADFSSLLGNDVTELTYAFAKKKMYQIPLSTTHTYPFPEDKDIEKTKKNFVWLGGVGMVHKGLDLVLEAFAKLPEYQLSVCGPVEGEKDFEKLYWNELYQTKNIKTLGRVDKGEKLFHEIIETSIALIHPSCSEGQSGSVIDAMHAGLIPVVSEHSGVNTDNFGITIENNTVEEIIELVKSIANMPNNELERRRREAWEYARRNHTRERFSEEFSKFVTMIEKSNIHGN